MDLNFLFTSAVAKASSITFSCKFAVSFDQSPIMHYALYYFTIDYFYYL